MIDERQRAVWATMVFVTLINGCSDRGPTTPPVPAERPPAVIEDTGPARTADEAVRRVLNGLRERKARAVWDFLPPSYRGEVQQLVRDVAVRLDDRTWSRTVAVWQKARKVLPSKGAVLFGPPSEPASSPETENPRTPINADGLKRLLDSVGESEFASLERLRAIDVGQFLDVTGSDVLRALGQLPSSGLPGDPFANLAKVEVRLVSESGDQATVRMQWPQQASTEHLYVRIEGHWLPQPLVNGWSSSLAEVRAQALAWADGLHEHPENWEASLKSVEQLLAELDSAKTDDAARLVWRQGLIELMSTWSERPSIVPENPRTDDAARKPRVPDTEELLPDKP